MLTGHLQIPARGRGALLHRTSKMLLGRRRPPVRVPAAPLGDEGVKAPSTVGRSAADVRSLMPMHLPPQDGAPGTVCHTGRAC